MGLQQLFYGMIVGNIVGTRVISLRELLCSFGVVVVVILLLSPIVQNNLIKPRLYDGTINNLGRYSFTFDAYEHISEESENAVIGIGSSKMREIFDGRLISNLTQYEGDYYNLGYAEDRPYVRMIELQAMIASSPKLMIIEVGPNTFSELDGSGFNYVNAFNHLASLNPYWNTPSWEHIIQENDTSILKLSRFEQINHYGNYGPVAIEESYLQTFKNKTQEWQCGAEWPGQVQCVPMQDDSEYSYDEYIQYPTQFGNLIQRIQKWNDPMTIEEFYGDALDNYLKLTYHNPQNVVNGNQLAFEHILEILASEGIPVLLVGLPYNPHLLQKLSDGQWDYYNQSIDTYSKIEGVHYTNFLWDDTWTEENFNDYTHASRLGEIKFAELISKDIDELLHHGG